MKNAALTFLLLTSLNAAAPGAELSPEAARLADEVRGKGWIVFPARSEPGDWEQLTCLL
jgi:hypothetical protein